MNLLWPTDQKASTGFHASGAQMRKASSLLSAARTFAPKPVNVPGMSGYRQFPKSQANNMRVFHNCDYSGNGWANRIAKNLMDA